MPAAAALIGMSEPIVRLLFERGAFDALATKQTAEALVAFATGLPAYVLIRVLQPGFFAREDTVTPTIFAGVSVVANIAISIWLFPTMFHVGIAIATAASSWINVVLLGATLAFRGHFSLPRSQWWGHIMIVLISAAMGWSLMVLSQHGAHHIASGSPLWRQILVVGSLIAYGVIFYFTLVHFSGTQRLGMLLRRVRRSR
jgi:putative peptidoglycan lipid II flippase